MSYNYSKTRTELSMIGAEAFALLDSNFSAPNAAPPPAGKSRAPPQHKRQPAAYIVQQVAPAKSTEKVINCYEAVNKYGGALLTEYQYPKKKPAGRKGFFF